MSCGRAGGAARALRSPSPSWSPASPGPGSGTGDEWPRKWDRLGAVTVNHGTAPQVGLPPAGGTEPRTPGGTGILRVGRPVGTAPAAPACAPPAHLSTEKKKAFPRQNHPSWQIFAARPPPLSRNTRCLSRLSLLTYIFFPEPFGKPQAPPTLAGVSPRSPPWAGDPSLDVPTLQSPSLVLKHPLDIFFPPLELLRFRHGALCASQSKQRREGAATLRMLWEGKGGGAAGKGLRGL